MAVQFIDPGGDHYQTAAYLGVTGSVTVDAAAAHTGPMGWLLTMTAAGPHFFTTSGISATIGRIQFWARQTTAASGTSDARGIMSNVVCVLGQQRNTNTLTITGATSGSGLVPVANQWYRFTFLMKPNGSNWDIKWLVDGVQQQEAVNRVATAGTTIQWGYNNAAATHGVWNFDDIYVDDSQAYTDPGDIRVTTKLPNGITGCTNTFTSNSGQFGKVNERPVNDTNVIAKGLPTAAEIEQFNVQDAATGDVNITNQTLIGRGSWLRAGINTGTATGKIYLDGSVTNISLTTTISYFAVYDSTTTYPGNTACGIQAQTSGTSSCNLYECGVLLAWLQTTTQSLVTQSSKLAFNTPAIKEPRRLISTVMAQYLAMQTSSQWLTIARRSQSANLAMQNAFSRTALTYRSTSSNLVLKTTPSYASILNRTFSSNLALATAAYNLTISLRQFSSKLAFHDNLLLSSIYLRSYADKLAFADEFLVSTTAQFAILVSSTFAFHDDEFMLTIASRKFTDKLAFSDEVLAALIGSDAFVIHASGNFAFRQPRPTYDIRFRRFSSSNFAMETTESQRKIAAILQTSDLALSVDQHFVFQIPWRRLIQDHLALATYNRPLLIPFNLYAGSRMAFSTVKYVDAVPFRRVITNYLAFHDTQQYRQAFYRLLRAKLAFTEGLRQIIPPWQRQFSANFALQTGTPASTVVWRRAYADYLAFGDEALRKTIKQLLLSSNFALSDTGGVHHGVMYRRLLDDFLAFHDTPKRKTFSKRTFSDKLAFHDNASRQAAYRLLFSSKLAFKTQTVAPTRLFLIDQDDNLAFKTPQAIRSLLFLRLLDDNLAFQTVNYTSAAYRLILHDYLAFHDNTRRSALLLRLVTTTLAFATQKYGEYFRAGSPLLKLLLQHGTYLDGANVREVSYGSEDVSVTIRFLDSGNGGPRTDVTSSSTGLVLWYKRPTEAKVTFAAVQLSGQTAAHTDGGIIHESDGYVRVDVPDAAFVTGQDTVVVGATATGMVAIAEIIDLVTPGDTVIINPTSINDSIRGEGSVVRIFTREENNFSWPAIYSGTDESTPVDLTMISTKNLLVMTGERKLLKSYANGEITVGGTDNNIPITTIADKIAGFEGKIFWSLRNTATNLVLGHGTGEVRFTP